MLRKINRLFPFQRQTRMPSRAQLAESLSILTLYIDIGFDNDRLRFLRNSHLKQYEDQHDVEVS